MSAMENNDDQPVWDGTPVDWDAEVRSLMDELREQGASPAVNGSPAVCAAFLALRRLIPGFGFTTLGLPSGFLVGVSDAPAAVAVPVLVWIGGWITAGWWWTAGRPDTRTVVTGAVRLGQRGAQLVDRSYSRTATRVRTLNK